MSGPISVDLPHRLGAEEAKRRIAGNMDSLQGHLPAGAQLTSAWQGDDLKLGVGVLGQQIEAAIDVQDRLVRVTVILSPALAFFGKAIEAGLRKAGPTMLEDRSKGRA